MNDKTVYDEASQVDAEAGVVSVERPDAVDVRLTADAAVETSDRLLEGAMKAQGQKVGEEKKQAAKGKRPPQL